MKIASSIQSERTALEGQRTSWDTLNTEVFRLCFPRRNFYEPEKPAKQLPTMYSSRGVRALKIACAGFVGYSSARGTEWFKLTFNDRQIDNLPGVSIWLEYCTKLVLAALTRGGYYESQDEIILDYHSAGIGCMYIEEKEPGRLSFNSRHPRAYWISEDAYGMVDTLHEDVYLTYRAIKQRFGDKIEARLLEQAEKNPYGQTTIRHIVKPMDESLIEGFEIDPKLPFISIWYDATSQEVLDMGGYWEFPFIVPRFSKTSGEVYGWGPGHDAISDILAAWQMQKSLLRAGNNAADPAVGLSAALEGQEDILPGSRIFLGDKDRIEPINMGANYPITVDIARRQDDLIDEHFNVQTYLTLQQLSGQMTAREVVERMGEKTAILGQVAGRYQTEALSPCIKRVFNILLRAGALPPVPKQLEQIKQTGGFLGIEFSGMLEMMRRQYYQSQGINNAIGFIGALVKINPQPLDIVRWDNLVREGLEANGAPPTLIGDDPTVQKERVERAKAQAAQMQAQQDQQEALMVTQNADKLGKKPEAGSPLVGMAEAKAQQMRQQ